MAGFIRRYLTDPGLEELTAIEGVVILDREPPGSITGVGAGTVCCVGEFEDGPVNVPTEVLSGGDLQATFGGLGFVYDGLVACNPCARSRKADSALAAELWNGNGFVALSGKKFRRLVVVRVDTSVGEVTFTRLAWLDGNTDPTWNLEPGQVLSVVVDGTPDTATFDAAVATMNSSAGTYPTTFAGGESVTITIDEGTAQQVGPTRVVFTSGDTTQALVVARINEALGYTAASVQGGNVTRIVGRVRGTSGSVKITAIDTLVATKTGLSVSTASGTGDCANIDAVTFAEAKALIEGDVAGVRVERSEAGAIRIVSLGTIAPSTPSIDVSSASTALAFGFPLDTAATPATHAVDGVIPAGTRVRNVGGTEWVTTRSVEVLASATTVKARVRPALDDGTTAGANPGTVVVMPFPIPGMGSWGVTNVLALGAALTESAIDAAYATAIDSTLNPGTVAKEVNVIFSARASNAIRTRLRSNAIEASESLYGRMAIVRPPLGTTRALARGSLQPGVGAYRDQRVVYCFPGVRTFVAKIAARGTSGGAGFTADGNIDVGADSWLASVMSQLNPEENPGQITTFTSNVIGLEAGNADISDLREGDYRAFKRAGICAPRMDEGVLIFQSGVTSVDPLSFPALKNIARRRMADFIQDSLAVHLKPFAKKLASRERRATVYGEIVGFCERLQSSKNPASQRIDSYNADGITGNTPDTIAAGLYRVILKVRTLSSLEEIVLDTEIGENVVTVRDAA